MALKLAEIPQILSLLGLSSEQIDTVNAAAKERKIFAGQAAVEIGVINQERLDRGLMEQVVRKANAAGEDFATISNSGKQQAPAWLKTNWGNNGVNAAIASPSMVDGAIAAANIAQNITMLANENPAIAQSPEVQGGIGAASNLALGIAGHISMTADDLRNWQAQATTGLREAVRQAGVALNDEKGSPINIEDFITARFQEIEKGGQLKLQSAAINTPAPQEEINPTRRGFINPVIGLGALIGAAIASNYVTPTRGWVNRVMNRGASTSRGL